MKHARAAKSVLAATFTVLALIAGSTTPAFAGTLTSASFTASTPYTYTNAQNTRYDWGFTTATSSTLSKVTATVPAGTGGSSRFLSLPATNGNYASTPDSPVNSITGDIDIRAKVRRADWSVLGTLVAKYQTGGSNSREYNFRTSGSNTLELVWSTNGTGAGVVSTASDVTYNFANNSTQWVRVTLAATPCVTKYYTSTDGSSWSQLGSSRTCGASTSIFDSSSVVEIGSTTGGTVGRAQEDVYYAELRNGINGTVVNKFDPNDATATEAATGSWPSSSSNTETWTVNRSGTNQPADIATDLNVGSVAGVPTGGTANYRFIDGSASYYFATATSVPASTPCTINLGGFINTATAGNYSSLIKTWDNAGTPAVVDSVTTATLAFTDYSSSQSVAAVVDPSFLFSVGNLPAPCMTEPSFSAGAGSATGVNLGHLAASSTVSGGQWLTIDSNAINGFSVYVKGTQASQNLRSTGHNWTDVTGTYASPGLLGAGERFGYTYHDATTSTLTNNPGANQYIALTNAAGSAIMGSASTSSGVACISYIAQTAAATPAGTYSATVTYTAVPAF